MVTTIQGIKQNPDLLKDDLRRMTLRINDLIGVNNRGFFELTSTTITGSITLNDTSTIWYVNASTGNSTITLPTPSDMVGRTYWVKRIDSSANTLELVGLLDGSTSSFITSQWDSLTINAASTQWFII